MTSSLERGDDLRHRPPAGSKSRDSLFFNLILPDHDLALQVYTWVDHEGVAGRQVAVFGPDRRPIALDVETSVAMGDADFDDWSVAGLEVRHLTPLQTASVRFNGDQVHLTYDFEGIHEPFAYSQNAEGCPQWMASDRFEQTGRVSGELVVDGRTIAFDRLAHRDHSWGRRHWGMPQHWKWVVAQTPLGVGLNVMFWIARGDPGINGYVLRDNRPVPIESGQARAGYDDDMTQRSLTATVQDADGGVTELRMNRFGLLRLASASDTAVYEAACSASIDGEPGWGQFEVLWPKAYLERLLATEH